MVRLGDKAKEAIERGRMEVRVRRAGALQNVELVAKRLPLGQTTYLALCTDKFIDLGELVRVAEEVGLPIISGNGKTFPRGKGAADFAGL